MEKRKIVWAVDPFSKEKTLITHSAKAIKGYLGTASAEIIPVYVLMPTGAQTTSSNLGLLWFKEYLASAKKEFKKIFAKSKMKGLKPAQVLMGESYSMKSAAKRLNEFAKEVGADTIVVSSHARKGLQRMFLGSFAETVLLHSDVPVLTVNPSQKSFTKVKKILFPTDLSDQSKAAFEQTLRYAKSVKAQVLLYHKIPNPVEPVIGTGVYLLGGTWVPVKTYFDREREEREKLAQEWLAGFKTKVKVTLLVDSVGGSVADSIVKATKKHKADLIALAGQSGPMEALALGSVARQVVRSATKPVWVVHVDRDSVEARQGVTRRPTSTSSELII